MRLPGVVPVRSSLRNFARWSGVTLRIRHLMQMLRNGEPSGTATQENRARPSGLLRWIAVFKLVKGTLTLLVGFGVLKLIGHDSAATLSSVVQHLGIDPGRRYVDLAIGKLVAVRPDRLKEVGFASFVYAAMFFTEGLGLWWGKRWAEWFTAIFTLSLVPIELYELYVHASIVKVLVLLVNIAVAVYLILRIRHERNEVGGRMPA